SLGRNQSGGRFGSAVATADFNGDGYPDLAVGAPNEVRFGNPVGSVFVYLGSADREIGVAVAVEVGRRDSAPEATATLIAT
ncbi:MAG: integrin alpha, partial [Sandaracinaceae bacterium]|nr:integrin alpha [Sandaracinaceae bacterium]